MKKINTVANFFLKNILLAGIFCLVFLLAHKAVFDLDIWLHLKTGEIIVQNQKVPTSDIFSYTMKGKPWIDHEWLFQAIVHLVYAAAGPDGLILLQSIIFVLTFLVLFIIANRYNGSYVEAAVFLILTAFACQPRFNIRPDIFSLLFFSIFLYFLNFHSHHKRLWVLVIVQLLWVNMHGYFFLGPLLALIFISAEFLRRKCTFLPWLWRESGALKQREYRNLNILFPSLILVSLLNPGGWKGALYPVQICKDIITGQNKIFFQYINELRPTFESGKLSQALLIIFVLSCAVLALNFKRLRLVDLFLYGVFFLFGLKIRNIPFFAFIAYAVLVAYFSSTSIRLSAKLRLRLPRKQVISTLLAFVLPLFLAIWTGVKINALLLQGRYASGGKKEIKSLLMGVDDISYPKAAADFLLENRISSRMLNDFNSGAYLIGRVYPLQKVFIDGRTELYGPAFFQEYLKAFSGDKQAFEKTVAQYNIELVFFSMTFAEIPRAVSVIHKSPQWKLVFVDGSGVVFLKDVPAHKELIGKFAINLNEYQAPPADLKTIGLKKPYPWDYIKRAQLFYILKEYSAALSEAKEALRIMPHCAKAHLISGKIYLRQELYEQALEHLRSAAIFLPGNFETLDNLSLCFEKLQATEAATRILEMLARKDKTHSAKYNYRLGRIYLSTNDERNAVAYLKRAVKSSPRNKRYRYALAEALFKKGQGDNDVAVLLQAKEEFCRAQSLLSGQDNELRKKIEERLKELKEPR